MGGVPVPDFVRESTVGYRPYPPATTRHYYNIDPNAADCVYNPSYETQPNPCPEQTSGPQHAHAYRHAQAHDATQAECMVQEWQKPRHQFKAFTSDSDDSVQNKLPYIPTGQSHKFICRTKLKQSAYPYIPTGQSYKFIHRTKLRPSAYPCIPTGQSDIQPYTGPNPGSQHTHAYPQHTVYSGPIPGSQLTRYHISRRLLTPNHSQAPTARVQPSMRRRIMCTMTRWCRLSRSLALELVRLPTVQTPMTVNHDIPDDARARGDIVYLGVTPGRACPGTMGSLSLPTSVYSLSAWQRTMTGLTSRWVRS